MNFKWLICLGLGVGTATAAQDLGGFYGGMASNGLTTNQINITQRAVGRNLEREVRGQVSSASADREGAATDPAVLTFKASSAVRRRNYQQFVAKTRAADPSGAASLAETLKSDPVSAMAPELAKYGLRVDNVADAYAVYWVEAWQAAHGVTGESSRETANAVKQQAADAILATPELARSTDAQKQELADALLVQALLIGAAREQNKDDSATLGRIAAAVRQGAQAFGLDLDALTLTPQGFVSARETGAADSASDGSVIREEAVAATEPTDVGSPYVLLAAAGGAGIGAAFLLGKSRGRRR